MGPVHTTGEIAADLLLNEAKAYTDAAKTALEKLIQDSDKVIIRRVTISNCVFDGTDSGIRLKSSRGRGGVVEDHLIKIGNTSYKIINF